MDSLSNFSTFSLLSIFITFFCQVSKEMDQVVGSIICLDGTAVEYVGVCERQVLFVENLEKALAKVRSVC